MSVKTNISIWIFSCVIVSMVGFFIDFLLSTELRKKERYEIQRFFGKIFDSINNTNFARLQLLMVRYVLIFKNKLFGQKILSFRYLIISLLLSQFLTVLGFSTSSKYFIEIDPGFVRVVNQYGKYNMIPFFPFISIIFVPLPMVDRILLLEFSGFFWNNYLFDSLAIMSTCLLLKVVYERQKYFAFIAMTDIIFSYLLSYLCLILYFITPPNSNFLNINFFTFIPDLWHKATPEVWRPWVCYSLTTFVPIALYMSLLLFLSVSKCLQWILATVAYDFSKDNEKTAFFKLASVFSVTALLFKALYEILKSLNQ